MIEMKVQIKKTFKYRLYGSDKNRHLHHQINVAGLIWNHALTLQKRHYRLTGKYIPIGKMQKHIAKLRMGGVSKYKERSAKPYGKKYTFWKVLDSQATQDVIERLDRAYQDFFSGKVKGVPRFKKVKKYKSATYKQSGWKVADDTNIRLVGGVNGGKTHQKAVGHIKVGGHFYKYIKSRPLPFDAKIKTVTIKRDACGRLFVCFSVECEVIIQKRVMMGKSAGLDFGLKTFLTDDTGHGYKSPEFLRQELATIKRQNKIVSRKERGSKRKKKARHTLNRTQIRVADKREDSHYKLAHELCEKFDVIYLETLNISAMKKLWGRKVSDLAFAKFVTILKWIASKHGTRLIFIGRWEPTTKTCSGCGSVKNMSLSDRQYECENCGLDLKRDHNAAINIKRVGASILLQEVCQTTPSVA